jgi:transposase
VPEPVDETWAGSVICELVVRSWLLRTSLGTSTSVTSECVWSAALTTAPQPFRSTTWPAAMAGVPAPSQRGPGPHPTAGWGRFQPQVHRDITRRGGEKPCLWIARNL